MSRFASLNITFGNNLSLSAVNVIEALESVGWQINANNKVVYLPLNDDEMFNWTSSELPKEALFNLIEEKESKYETVGLEMYWNDLNVGMHLLEVETNKFCFTLNINRMYVDKENDIMDFNWYANKIIPCFKQFHICEYSFIYEF